MSESLHLGLLINPLAGLGGGLAMKGSDGDELRERAMALTDEQRGRSQQRATRALECLQPVAARLRFSTWGGVMGAGVLAQADFNAEVLGYPGDGLTGPGDTREAVARLVAAGVELLVFVGGDGTARDIYDVVGEDFPVLGIPAGVKMHSGVFAVSPEAAGELLLRLVKGGLVGVRRLEVRDIDEDAFREDVVRSRFYGEMSVPGETRFLQQTKIGGREDQNLAAAEIAQWQVEQLQADRTYLVGPGSTTAAIMEELGLPNTLLGVDVIRGGKLVHADASEADLLALLQEVEDAALVVTAIGGQGHIFGRGNQQFSPEVIRRVGRDNIVIVATKSKIAELQSRPLLVDTNDARLDEELCGLFRVNTGYDDYLLYRVDTVA